MQLTNALNFIIFIAAIFVLFIYANRKPKAQIGPLNGGGQLSRDTNIDINNKSYSRNHLEKVESESIVREFSESLEHRNQSALGLKRESSLPHDKEKIRSHIIQHLLDVLIDGINGPTYFKKLIALETLLLWYVDDNLFESALSIEKKIFGKQPLSSEESSLWKEFGEISLKVAAPHLYNTSGFEHINSIIRPYGFDVYQLYNGK